MATTYRVSFDVVIDHGDPARWIVGAVCDGLEDNEQAFNWEFRVIDEQVDMFEVNDSPIPQDQ